MDLVFSESSSRILSEYWYKYKADHFRKLHPKPIYPDSKPLPCSVSLYGVSFQHQIIKSLVLKSLKLYIHLLEK